MNLPLQQPRRAFLKSSFSVAVTLTGIGWPNHSQAESSKEVFTKDIDFLLKEMEKQAGHFFKLKKIDWAKVTKEFQAAAQQTKNEVEHIEVCQRLVARLRDGHATLDKVTVRMPDESKGKRFTGPRVQLLVVDRRVYVRQAFKDALTAGISIGQEVLEIDGKSALLWVAETADRLSDKRGYGTDAAAVYAACHLGLADYEGKPIEFTLAQNGGKKKVKLVRNGGPNYAPIGPVFYPPNLQSVGRQSYGKTPEGMGYIHLRDVPGNLPEQLDAMLEAIGDVPGLILDCRANSGGGCDHEAVFGRFLPTGKRWKQYTGSGKHPYAGPMIVIVDAGVVSAGETVSGIFKEDGRAYMIGDAPTAGSSSSKTTVAAPSGLFSVYFSVNSNKGRFNGGTGIEGIGVPPHELTPYLPADLSAKIDTQIRIATELLKAGLPKGKVPWQG